MARSPSSMTVATSRGLVLDLVRTRGPISRVELAAATGLTQATMTSVVRELITEELIKEAGRSGSNGGKPRTLLEVNVQGRYAVGVQFGADEVTVLITDLAGSVVGRIRDVNLATDDPENVVAHISSRVRMLIAHLQIPRERVLGIGIVVPGPLSMEHGTLLAPPTLRGWERFPLRDEIARRTGMMVLLDNDATAAALGEFWSGALVNSRAHCTIYMGSGIGSGIVLSGTIYRGSSSNTGEIGQMPVISGDASSAFPQTFEQLAAPAAVAARAMESMSRDELHELGIKDEDTPYRKFGIVSAAAVRGHEQALGIMAESASYIALAALITANLLDLDSISLAGPAFVNAGTLYVQRTRETLEQHFASRLRHGVDVRLATHVGDAAAVGGAAMVLQEQLAPRSIGTLQPQVVAEETQRATA